MERPIHTSLAEIFEELTALHRSMEQGLAALSVLEKGTDSPEMADALGLVHSHLQSASDGMGQLAAIGKRAVLGTD